MSYPPLSVRAWCLGLVGLVAAASLPVQAVERGPDRSHSSASVRPQSNAQVIVKYKADSGLARILSASSSGTTSAAATGATTTTGPRQAATLAMRLGVPLTDGRALGPRTQVIRGTGLSSADLAARLAAQSDVEYAEVDARVHVMALTSIPNDPLFVTGQATTPVVGQWYLRAPGGDGEIASINAEAAWSITTGKSSVVVADIDTGITPHSDLVGKSLPGYDFISDAATAGDGGGRDSDPTDPGDFVTSAEAATLGCDATNSSWHGTQTAGLIGALTNNGIGMASVGRDVMLLPLRALGKCGGDSSDIVAAMLWAAGISVPGVPANAHPAKVINMSLGSESTSCGPTYQDAVNQVVAKGVVVVVAAGNLGQALGAPANCTNVIAVGGVRHAGTKVGYSDLGSGVTISAPAGNCVNGDGQTCLYPIVTTTNSGATVASTTTTTYTDGDIDPSLGTSFSTPMVAGTVALMFSVNPTLSLSQVRSALTSTARAFPQSGSAPIQRVTNGPFVAVAACADPSTVSGAQGYECYCTTSTCGAGLLDTGLAVAAAAAIVNGAPTANITSSPSTVTAGTSVTFSAGASTSTGSNSIASYQWTITSGTTIASFSSATNASSATVLTSAAGTFTVSLTVTDSAGQSGTTTSTVTVGAAVAPVTTTSGTSSSGGGGGSVSPAWLLGLLLAAVALFLVAPRRRR